MENISNPTKSEPVKLVKKAQLLELLFDEGSRPTERWLYNQVIARRIPFVKIGGTHFFDPVQVRASLARRNSSSAQ